MIKKWVNVRLATLKGEAGSEGGSYGVWEGGSKLILQQAFIRNKEKLMNVISTVEIKYEILGNHVKNKTNLVLGLK